MGTLTVGGADILGGQVFGVFAVVIFAFAYFFNGFGFHPSGWIGPFPFVALGLACLAIHLLGGGVGQFAITRRQ